MAELSRLKTAKNLKKMLIFCGLSSANRSFLCYNRIMIRAADKPETAEGEVIAWGI